MTPENPKVQLVAVAEIEVLNPRTRNPVTFQTIVSNIANIGLKRPITVSRKPEPVEGKVYDLVCGQGRLEAYQALGQEVIPAIVTEVAKQDCFLMSLVENIARRHQSPVELMREVSNLKSRGYNAKEISQKIDIWIPRSYRNRLSFVHPTNSASFTQCRLCGIFPRLTIL